MNRWARGSMRSMGIDPVKSLVRDERVMACPFNQTERMP